MPVTRGQIISRTDLQALAVLANSKIAAGLGTPYDFAAFAGKDQIELPADISPAPTYGSGFFPDGEKVTLWLFAYKIIAGTLTYTWTSLVKAFNPTAGSGDFAMGWTWTSPTGAAAPDGYLAVIPLKFTAERYQYAWQDIGNVETFAEDGSFSDPNWKFDTTMQTTSAGQLANALPCGHGAWLRTMNLIHRGFASKLDIYGGAVAFDDTHKISGPWCVSVAPKCYLKLLNKSAYKNLHFLYSEADSVLGNELAPEADMLALHFGVNNGTNNFNFGVDGTLSGRIVILSDPQGQSAADWTVSTTPAAGITYTFDANYLDGSRSFAPFFFTAFIFDFVDVPYTVGTPIVLTVTPTAGGSVFNAGNPVGAGGILNIVFTADKQVLSTSDMDAIDYSGVTGKVVDLTNTLVDIVFTSPTAGAASFAAHWRCFCNGVFLANTLPTLGVMPYLDQDLPQYSPRPDSDFASTRREVLKPALPAMPHVNNRAALWPVFRDLDFNPNPVNGFTVSGSKAWNVLGTKYAHPIIDTASVALGGQYNYSVFIDINEQDVRFYTSNPAATLLIRANDFPTPLVYDLSVPGGTWVSLAAAIPGFQTDTTWFYSVYNPTSENLSSTTIATPITDLTAPNGTFFPTHGAGVPNTEGYSYHFPDPATVTHRPIPLFGYCVYSLTLRRQAVSNGIISTAPSTGTAELPVKIGIMDGFGFDAAGVFTELLSTAIPAGEASVTVDVFWPVLSGTPLAYQCAEIITVRALVNFQPMMHSAFDATANTYCGAPWYDQDKALLFLRGGFIDHPIVLPFAEEIYNDLEAALNAL